MKNAFLTKVSLIGLLCLLIILTGCCIQIGCWPARAKYERQVLLSAPLEPGSTFEAQTHNGSITIKGADVTDCNLTATIIARAQSEQDARKLAEQTRIKLQTSAKRLITKIEKPGLVMNQSISVNLDVIVPNHTDLQLSTHNGAVEISNITGQTNATTHNGRVITTQLSGTTRLRTHNGSITCEEISGDVNLRTHNGRVNAFYSQDASPVCNVSIVTHNGGVEFTAPPNFSAKVEASTHNGSIKTELPITVLGEVSKRKLSGTIGTGQGKLHLETHNGSIKIK